MIRILFVCHGNICRSPLAEFYMRDLVERRGVSDRFEIASAATDTDEIWDGHGNPVYPPVRALLSEHGISCEGKRARLLTKSDYFRYDYLIGMDRENMSRMRRLFGGDPDGKLFMLMDFTDHPGEVSDPWYTRDFEATWRDVSDGCRGLSNKLEGFIYSK